MGKSSKKVHFLLKCTVRLREWWWRRKEEQREGAVGCEMWMCVCVCSFGLSCQGRRLSFDPVESWCGTSSYVGSWKSTGNKQRDSLFSHEKKGSFGTTLGTEFQSEHFFLLLVLNLTNSSGTRNSVPKLVRRELCSQSGLSCFFSAGIWYTDAQCCQDMRERAKPILSRHARMSQELRTCQEQQQHTNTLLYRLAQYYGWQNNWLGSLLTLW